MKLLDLYEWIAGNMSDFTRPFRENENLATQAKNFWRDLENASVGFIFIAALVAILAAVIYYIPFNNKPGRHYRPLYWFLFWCATLLISFGLTFGYEYIFCEPKLNGALLLELKIAFGNAIYSILLYLIISIVWCWSLPTNAYRIFKK